VRIHLGHHFYGAGNLGDDFMLAGFLGAMRTLAPDASFSCCVPFALEPLRPRFPEITWQACDAAIRERCIAECDVWLGLGGSPFQSAQSRWFVDHLVGEEAWCRRERKPMFFLGVGVQTAEELVEPDIQRICSGAAGIWTRDPGSAQRLAALPSPPPVAAAADLAHLFFRGHVPPAATPKRVTLVANFDYGAWPGQPACLSALGRLAATDFIWLAQESRDLPGAERALYATLADADKSRWRFVSPEQPGASLPQVFARWPSGEWLVTARYHAALAGAWAGSKIAVLSTNEKLRAAARELGAPLLSPHADESTVLHALALTHPTPPPRAHADRAYAACAEFLRSAVAHRR
jgi:polysaccharide pyruvyl transferase WcaK-like protein